MNDIDHLACYIAAAVHDYRHPGLSNDSLINSGDKVALTYNDKSPLENFHAAEAFEGMHVPAYNFLSHMSKHCQKDCRQAVINQILCTDMKTLFNVVSRFNLHFGSVPDHLSHTHTDVLSQMILKCADIGHTAYAWSLHAQWSERLKQEMFAQGDKEKIYDISVSPGMDPNHSFDSSRSQVGLFDVVVLPMMNALTRVFPACRPLIIGSYTLLKACKLINAWILLKACRRKCKQSRQMLFCDSLEQRPSPAQPLSFSYSW